MSKKKSFTHFISPVSWFLSIGAILIALILLFRPSVAEFVWAFVVVDGVSLSVLNAIFFPIFYKLVPQSKSFFFGVDSESFASLKSSERIELLESMMRFPKQYALAMYLGSFLKSIPFYFMVVFYWEHQVSNFSQFLMMFTLTGVCYVYFYGCALFDAHARINVWIEELHQKFNLSNEFERLQIPHAPGSLNFQEILVQIFMILFVLSLQSVIIISKQYNGESELVFKVSAIGVIGLALFSRIWYLGRQEIFGGLTKIINHMKSIDLSQNTTALPLHSSALLASFEKTFNLLESRIVSSERKLRGVVFQESEKSRFHALGEMSGLIAHDLSAPLHAIQYCYNELKEQNIPEEMLPYIQHMGPNIGQAIDLISALRARLKNTTETIAKTTFLDAHDFVIRLLEIQFSAKLFERIRIDLDPLVAELVLAIPRVDLMQILDNLYRNSIKNLITTTIEKPILKIRVYEKTDGIVKIRISDNGSGLSMEEFNLMTDENQIADLGGGTSRGLGLRLTRRLVEHYGGSLFLTEPQSDSNDASGTNFCLRLKLFENN